MSIALLLIPLALALLGAAVYAFFWAVDNDQFEDLDTVAVHLLDDDPPAGPDAPPPAAPLPLGTPTP
jgi:cbb3-type cytochrome oxidase maturation protein